MVCNLTTLIPLLNTAQTHIHPHLDTFEMLRALTALLPLLAQANAYFILQQPILETTRLDP